MKTSTQIGFCAGHRLMYYEGACRNLHGHNYTCQVEATCPVPAMTQSGMVVDFKVIKQFLKAWIDEHWDHGVVLNREDVAIIQFCHQNDMKYFILPYNPTAENMALFLRALLTTEFYGKDFTISAVTIEETLGCSATSTEAD